MSDKTEGAAASALGAHSKDAQPEHSRSATGGKPAADKPEAEGVLGKAARLVDDLGETVSRGGERAYRQTGQAAAYVSGAVRSEPLAFLLGIGAIGFALGVLFSRR